MRSCILRVILDDIAEAALAVNGFHMHLGVDGKVKFIEEKRKWQNPNAGKTSVEGADKPMDNAGRCPGGNPT